MPQFAADISYLIRNWGKHFYVFNYDQFLEIDYEGDECLTCPFIPRLLDETY